MFTSSISIEFSIPPSEVVMKRYEEWGKSVDDEGNPTAFATAINTLGPELAGRLEAAGFGGVFTALPASTLRFIRNRWGAKLKTLAS